MTASRVTSLEAGVLGWRLRNSTVVVWQMFAAKHSRRPQASAIIQQLEQQPCQNNHTDF